MFPASGSGLRVLCSVFRGSCSRVVVPHLEHAHIESEVARVALHQRHHVRQEQVPAHQVDSQ